MGSDIKSYRRKWNNTIVIVQSAIVTRGKTGAFMVKVTLLSV